MTPLSTLVPLGAGANAAPSGAWVLSTAFVGPNGRNYGVASTGTGGPAICRGSGSPLACFSSHGFHTLINYQPASRFWAFQGIEAGIFIVLAAALIAVAYRVVLTRDA
jgi:hypothetical protein